MIEVIKECMKECFEHDKDVLKEAFNSDKLLCNLMVVYFSKIWDVLELKGIITEEEKIKFLHEVKEQLKNEKNIF